MALKLLNEMNKGCGFALKSFWAGRIRVRCIEVDKDAKVDKGG
jgi:hypothetical protein